ncbi:MAG TPA: lysophospholipid acyltransferase family protein [Rhodothermales bacterium]|nr:lysophospholipid acyltransferase family protein [Rhodothermales bacterium]
MQDLSDQTADVQEPPSVLPDEGQITPSLGTRLWFAWFCLVTVLVTVPMSIIQIVSHQFWPTARNFKRWSGTWGRSIQRLLGISVVVEEQVHLDPEQPYVFVANHQNTLDIFTLAGYLPCPFGFVAKAELARTPILGPTIRQSASIYIDRSDPRKSLASIQEAGRRIREGTSVLIFAEGARSYSSWLGPFKKGAFILAVEAAVPLVPVTLVNAYQFMDERHYAARPGTIRLLVGEPIPMAGKRRRDIPEVMDTVRAQMEQALATHREELQRNAAVEKRL